MSKKTPDYEAYVERTQLQSTTEREAWAQSRQDAIKGIEQAREAAEASRAARELRKLNPSRITPAQSLVRAAGLGDVAGCLQWIKTGANLNGQDRQGKTPLALCLDAGAPMELVAITLLKAGGKVAPVHSRSDLVLFNLAVAAGPISEQDAEPANEHTVRECLNQATSWSLAKVALETCGKKLGDVEKVRKFGQTLRLDLACAFHAEGGRLADPFWEEVATHWKEEWSVAAGSSSAFSLSSVRGFESMMDVIASGKEGPMMSQGICESLFAHAAKRGNSRLLCALLDGGLRPNIHWVVSIDMPYGAGAYYGARITVRCALLLACAAGDTREAFDVARRYPPIVESALTHDEHPGFLSAIMPSRLGDLEALGVKLDAVDSEGNGLAHWWAKNGRLDGWSTLAEVAPKAFDLLNRSGKRGVDLVIEAFEDPGALAAFQNKLARNEGRLIARETQRAPRSVHSKPRL